MFKNYGVFVMTTILCLGIILGSLIYGAMNINNFFNTTDTQVCVVDRLHTSCDVINSVTDTLNSRYNGNVVWCGSKVTLEDYVDTSDDIVLSELYNMFKCNDSIFVTHIHTNLTDTLYEHPCTNTNLQIDSVALSFEDAISAVRASNVMQPHTRFITLCQSNDTLTKDAIYVFGDDLVYVNANTGEVYKPTN